MPVSGPQLKQQTEKERIEKECAGQQPAQALREDPLDWHSFSSRFYMPAGGLHCMSAGGPSLKHSAKLPLAVWDGPEAFFQHYALTHCFPMLI